MKDALDKPLQQYSSAKYLSACKINKQKLFKSIVGKNGTLWYKLLMH